MVLELAYVSDRPSLVDVQWFVRRKVLDAILGNPKRMTHEPHEEIVFFPCTNKATRRQMHIGIPSKNVCKHATESTKC